MDKDTFERILHRERMARKEAERIMETKSLELYDANKKLKELNTSLEQQVQFRTNEIVESEKQLSMLFENHPFPLFVYRLSDFKILAVNATAISKYGYSRADFLRKTIVDLHPKKEQAKVKVHISNIKKGMHTYSEWTHQDSSNGSFDIIARGNDIRYKEEAARIVVVEDISDRKILEREKEEQKRQYQDLIESSTDIIFQIDEKGRFTYMNPAGIELSEFDQKDIIGKSFIDLITDKYKKRVTNFYKFQLENQLKTTYTEFPISTKSGKEIWLGQNVEASTLENQEGTVFNARARDITEQKRLEKALLRSEEKYRSVIENMELGLMEVDPEGKIIKAYPQFCHLSGYSPQELEGKFGTDILLTAKGKELYSKQLKNRIQGKTAVYEIEMVCKDGSSKWVLVSGAPFYDEYNRFKGSFGIHLDITAQKLLETELKIARDKAQEALKSKELFLANISHEIRTPLNAVIGISELLNETNTGTHDETQIKHLTNAGKSLLSLIDELLIIAKYDAHKQTLDLSLGNLYNCVKNSFELFEAQAAAKNFEYILDLNISEEAIYMFDERKLGQVLQNILSNAIKFTSYGEVKLSVEIYQQEEDADLLKFIVKDTGIGIPKDDLHSIFENFEQASNNNEGRFGGTGLGLPIVKSILNTMGGEIIASSENGVTLFEFHIKLQRSSIAELQMHNKKDIRFTHDFENITVLVAEDNKVNQFLIESQLKTLNIRHHIVNNGKEAVNFLKNTPVDLVLMDMRMPVMDGPKATEVIRNSLGMKKLPIIAITANADKFHRNECFRVGMNDFLTKPYSLAQIQLCISKNLPVKIPTKAVTETSNDMAFKKKLDAIFIEESEVRLLQLEQCLLENNLTKIKDICHSIRPSLVHMKEHQLVAYARSIEFEPCNLQETTIAFSNELKKLIEKLKQNM